jgi:hypothetical protein
MIDRVQIFLELVDFHLEVALGLRDSVLEQFQFLVQTVAQTYHSVALLHDFLLHLLHFLLEPIQFPPDPLFFLLDLKRLTCQNRQVQLGTVLFDEGFELFLSFRLGIGNGLLHSLYFFLDFGHVCLELLGNRGDLRVNMQGQFLGLNLSLFYAFLGRVLQFQEFVLKISLCLLALLHLLYALLDLFLHLIEQLDIIFESGQKHPDFWCKCIIDNFFHIDLDAFHLHPHRPPVPVVLLLHHCLLLQFDQLHQVPPDFLPL